jgi:protein ImuB
MYACVYAPAAQTAPHQLLALALEFSPVLEQSSPGAVVFPIDALRKLIGSPHQIASEICRWGHVHKFEASLAIASTPDTALLLARHYPGVTLASTGEEHLKLARIPLQALFAHVPALDPALLEILHRWGLETCEDLAALPERGVAERLGQPGVYLRDLARGAIDRPLRVPPPATNYEERVELEHALDLLEPLLFLLGRALHELCSRLRSQSRAARTLEARFELEARKTYRCELEFPVPLDRAQALLKLLQLHLEQHPPEAAVVAFTLRIDPAEPRRIQGGIFLPPTPPPDKLQITLARIAAMVGQENVGTPKLLNTHRPDAFAWTSLNLEPPDKFALQDVPVGQQQTLRLAMRLFRPALEARVRLVGSAPKSVAAAGVKGSVLRCAGPWKTSGEWWAATAWTREEWDVELDDGALYRIYSEIPGRAWFVHAVYD